MRLFTLIHVHRDQRSIHNSLVRSFEEQVGLYVACAWQLHASLRRAGVELVVATNDAALLRRAGAREELPIVEVPFTLAVPSGVRFYSAHFKIDMYRYLGTLDEPYVGLVDSDVVCVNPMPPGLANAIATGTPLYYDVTNQVTPAHGAATIIADKERLQPGPWLGLWAGGEFFAGPPSFFRALHAEAMRATPVYFSDPGAVHHQSEEMPTAVAVERLIRSGVPLVDAGALAVIGRYWSVKTLHVQRPLAGYRDHFLVHLPADKHFLAGLDPARHQGPAFFRAYERYLRRQRRLGPARMVGAKVRAIVRGLSGARGARV